MTVSEMMDRIKEIDGLINTLQKDFNGDDEGKVTLNEHEASLMLFCLGWLKTECLKKNIQQ